MTVIHVDGNLLTSDCNVILHQCNCLPTMGAGIAKSIKTMYPEAWIADRDDPRQREKRLGGYSYAYIERNGLIVGNLYGQLLPWGAGVLTDYAALENALRTYLDDLDAIRLRHGISVSSKIGVPYRIGCGLARGDWNVVMSILSRVAAESNRALWVYRLEGV